MIYFIQPRQHTKECSLYNHYKAVIHLLGSSIIMTPLTTPLSISVCCELRCKRLEYWNCGIMAFCAYRIYVKMFGFESCTMHYTFFFLELLLGDTAGLKRNQYAVYKIKTRSHALKSLLETKCSHNLNSLFKLT